MIRLAGGCSARKRRLLANHLDFAAHPAPQRGEMRAPTKKLELVLTLASLLVLWTNGCSSSVVGEGDSTGDGDGEGSEDGTGGGFAGADGSGGAASNGGSPSGSGGAGGGSDGSGGGLSSGGSGSGGGATGGGGSGGESNGTGGEGTGGEAAGPTLPPTDDYSEPGPFSTAVDELVGPNGDYTVFRPQTLGEDGFLHAPIIFGPGIAQLVDVHTQMLTNFASHGFVVVGTPVLNQGPGGDENLAKMQAGLDWILEQNDAAGIYQGNLWVDHAIAMGFSVGGTSAVELGGDPAILTVVSIHGHTATADLRGTMLQTTGTMDAAGMPHQQNTFDSAQVPTFLATLTGASHGYIEQAGGGEQRPAIVAWMRYWIYGDTGAEHYFFGSDCVLCMPPWENPQRKNWE